MGLLDVFRRADRQFVESQHAIEVLEVERGQIQESYGLLQERLAELELAMEDTGWTKMSMEGHREFSRHGLQRIVDLARLNYLKNPLIRRSVDMQAFYVFGLGLNFGAKHELVNDVVQRFLDDVDNQVELTSQDARKGKEIELETTGNLFFCFFTNALTGRVRVRSIPLEEIQEIVTDPQDRKKPWFYKRVWTEQVLDTESGSSVPQQNVAYYPDWRYQPDQKVRTIGGAPVLWDVPVYHVKVGGFSHWTFGCPEIYPALDWARAVKDDLEDYATVKRALARFAWSLQTKGGAKGVAAAKTKLNTNLASNGQIGFDTNPPPLVGSTFVGAEGVQMQPVKTASAQPSPDEGRRLWLMVSAATGFPEYMIAGDAHTGNRATSKTLDRPTELKIKDRQELWANIHEAILSYVVDQAALAARGKLRGGRGTNDEGEPIVVLGEDPETGEQIDRHIDVDFPDILERDVTERVKAITDAATLGGFPDAGLFDKRTVLRLLLQALGEDDVDELLDQLAPTPGEMLQPPQPAPADGKPGQDAIAAKSQAQMEALAEALRELRAHRQRERTPAAAPVVNVSVPEQLAPVLEVHTPAAPAPEKPKRTRTRVQIRKGADGAMELIKDQDPDPQEPDPS